MATYRATPAPHALKAVTTGPPPEPMPFLPSESFRGRLCQRPVRVLASFPAFRRTLQRSSTFAKARHRLRILNVNFELDEAAMKRWTLAIGVAARWSRVRRSGCRCLRGDARLPAVLHGDRRALPSNTCLEFDGFVWLVRTSQSGRNHGLSRCSTARANYAHVPGTDLVCFCSEYQVSGIGYQCFGRLGIRTETLVGTRYLIPDT
jgi:hypothetical protein